MEKEDCRNCSVDQLGHEEQRTARRQFLKAAAASMFSASAGLSLRAAPLAQPTPEIRLSVLDRSPQTIDIDFSKVVGAIKPLNGVNGGPLMTRGAFDLSSRFSELGIKHVRLHDIPWDYDNVVDLNYVFPHFDSSENDPANYDFFLTDYYIKSVRAIGAEITYRLGYSAPATGDATGDPCPHDVPPKSFEKWAAVCAQIVKHYNHGWANGHHYNVKYWEIWNEPDEVPFWSGTPEQYYNLYEVTAKALKKVDPDLMVGGPALAWRLDFLDGFLQYCAKHQVPLDFLSWHIYAREPRDVVAKAAKVRQMLDKYGFSKTANVLNEWNYPPGDADRQGSDARNRRDVFVNEMGGPTGAAFCASVLIGLQDSSVTLADFYQGTNHFWGGLYDEFGVPRKPYFAFKAFKFLLDTPMRVSSLSLNSKGIAVIAGLSKERTEAAILLSNFGTECNHYDLRIRGLPWRNTVNCQTFLVDSIHDLDLITSRESAAGMVSLSQDVEVPSVCVIRIRVA